MNLNTCVIIVFLFQFIYANGWVFNNIDVEAVKALQLEKMEEFDAISSSNNDYDIEVLSRINLIYPGTKWCGAGDIANNFNDLGSEWKTDMCCREHDYCPDTIPAGETKYNLTNDAFFTRLSCACDDTFRKCLQVANSRAADNVGLLYFNALDTKCFRKDYPVKKCLKRGGWLNKKCLIWSYDMSAPQLYQWFDVHNYRS